MPATALTAMIPTAVTKIAAALAVVIHVLAELMKVAIVIIQIEGKFYQVPPLFRQEAEPSPPLLPAVLSPPSLLTAERCAKPPAPIPCPTTLP